MTQAPAKKRFNILKSLEEDDLIALYAFLDAPEVDYPALGAMVEKRFRSRPILLRIGQTFAMSMARIDAGEPFELDVQPMIAKNTLSLIINSGRLDAAKVFLAACVDKLGLEAMREIHTMLTAVDTDIKRISLLDRTWLDYEIHDRGQPTTIVMMCGASHRFGVELNAVAPWLESLPVNVIYLRDLNLTLYLTGVRSIGDLDESIARLRKDLDAIGSKRTVMMGSSGGTYGALLYGHRLGADQVVCFAGPTSLDAGNQEATERPVYQKIQKMADDGLLSVPDLRADYAANGIPVRYFYGVDYYFDAVQAERMEGLSNVALEGLDNYAKHVVIGEMARRNILAGVFADAARV